ncbi:hypothetical protein NP569_27670, partial [Vibrio parahaemolyticus]|nr:hypothetical protein [Vibrio parahaemolyticus]
HHQPADSADGSGHHLWHNELHMEEGEMMPHNNGTLLLVFYAIWDLFHPIRSLLPPSLPQAQGQSCIQEPMRVGKKD